MNRKKFNGIIKTKLDNYTNTVTFNQIKIDHYPHFYINYNSFLFAFKFIVSNLVLLFRFFLMSFN